jgi:hypothetical protein
LIFDYGIEVRMSRVIAGILVTLSFFPAALSGQSLPDWTGIWRVPGTVPTGSTIFDQATANVRGAAGAPGVRQNPPYNDEWEALYKQNIEKVKQNQFPDPFTNCGMPAGYPRIMNLPDVYEFVVRPEQVWIISENGPNIVRIYTDGRDHPAPADRWPTFSGDSVGHWEGDTLVFSTLSVKGWDTDHDSILDRTGAIISSAMHSTTRMRKVDDNTIEAQITIEDPKALIKPWVITRRYTRMPKGTRVYDYACAENNRNPVDATGRTLTLGPDGAPLDK